MSIVSNFNEQVRTLVNELTKLFPNDVNIAVFQSQMEIALMVYPRKVIDSFIKHLYPHKSEIMEEDEKFFLGKGKDVKEDYMSHALHITQLWKNKLNDTNKKTMWKFFKVMCILAERDIEERTKLK